MRLIVPCIAAALALAACSGSGSQAGPDSSIAPTALPSMGLSAPPSASAVPSGSASSDASGTPPAPPLPTGSDWTMIGAGLERPGAQAVLDAAVLGTSMVAAVLTGDKPDDFDAGIVYSKDAGATWKWGGVVADEGRTFPEAILLDPKEAVVVGSNQVQSASGIDSRAFMAVAKAPGYELKAVDLPGEFDGVGVQLQDIISVDGEWVVVGYLAGKPDAKGREHPTSAVWRSPDEGSTWRKQVLAVPGASDVVVKQLVIAPDGSWNLVGQVSAGDLMTQYDMLWLISTDQGRTFTQVGQKALSAPFDQGAKRIVFSADGSTGILGWTEVTEDHGSDSALWVSVPGHGISQIGTGGVPVSGSNPSGDFVDGILWNHETLVAWGSADGSYPMDDAEFWNLAGAELTPAATLPGNGTPLDVTTILQHEGMLTGFGFTGADLDQSDIGIWSAPLLD